MKEKVKIFPGNSEQTVEKAFNDWSDKNEVTIIDRKYTMAFDKFNELRVVMVIYYVDKSM